MHDTFPLPELDEPLTAPFWAAAADERLVLPRCGGCDRWAWYPVGGTCGPLVWHEVAGEGRLVSFAVVRHAFLPAYAGHLPFATGLVELDAAPGVRLATRLVDVEVDALVPDLPVRVTFRPLTFDGVDGAVLAPLFRLA